MSFTQSTFIYIFFPVVFLIYFISKDKFRNFILFIAGLIFVILGNPVSLITVTASVLCSFFSGKLMAHKHKKFYLTLCMILNIGMLFLPDKYSAVGISFFTFRAMSYVMDCYRDKCLIRKNIMDLALYITFFPELNAGPIERFGDFASQLETRTFDVKKAAYGIRRFCFGLSKKVIVADMAAKMTDTIFSYGADKLTPIAAWIGSACYMIQIYYDFSGYSDMALGIGNVFGFEFGENFNYPYISASITDFWRRWHISLSSWFKDYFYIPLGGNRKGMFRTILNKLIVFFCTGLWHGRSLTFIIWGMIHGICVSAETLIKRKKTESKSNIFSRICSHIVTIFIIMISFIFFRSDNVSYAVGYIKSMFTHRENHSLMAEVVSISDPFFIFCMILAVIFTTPLSKKIYDVFKEKNQIVTDNISYVFTAFLFVMSLLTLSGSEYSPFIYFRF